MHPLLPPKGGTGWGTLSKTKKKKKRDEKRKKEEKGGKNWLKIKFLLPIFWVKDYFFFKLKKI